MSKNKKKINITYSETNSGIVTGSSHLLEIKVFDKTTKILLDCGAIQESGKVKDVFIRNKLTKNMSDIDHVLVSHAHLDHVQNLCQLPVMDFNGKIYMTELTLKLMEHITLDGINIHMKTVEYLNKSNRKKGEKIYPYMDLRSRENMLSRVQSYGYEKWIQLEDGIKVKFKPNGHISGSSSVVIEVCDGYEKETILYMSDTSCKREIPFVSKIDIKKDKYSIAIVESTYGHVHIPERTEDTMVEDLYRIIKSTCIEKNGDVLIPSFALSRSTNLAYFIKKAYAKYPELTSIPIYMASPLMNKCHKTIGENAEFYDQKWKDEMDLFSWRGITPITEYKELLRIIKNPQGSVYISSSGMLDAGYNTLLTSEIIKGRKNCVAMVGYCAEGTTGRKLLDGKQQTLTSNIDGEKVTVNIRAKIENLQGLSSHASGKEVVAELITAEKKKMKHVIIVHGDKERAEGLAALVDDAYSSKVSIHIPTEGKRIKLT
jgi:metallo-beta-lactamase family protein